MLSGEMPMTHKHIHAQPGKALDRIIGRNLRAHAADAPHHVGEFDSWRRRFDSELTRFSHRIRRPTRADKRLRWHASIVQAIAAGKSPFNQRYARAQYGRA